MKILPLFFVLFLGLAACDNKTTPTPQIPIDNSIPEPPKEKPLSLKAPEVTDTFYPDRKIKRLIATSEDFQPGDTCYGGVTLFNEEGQKLEDLDFASCGELFKKTTFEYNDQGQTEKSFIWCDLENVEYVWHYNSAGQLLEMTASRETNVFPFRTTYTYNEKGEKTETKSMMLDGRPFPGTARKEHFYENGLCTLTICYDNFGKEGYHLKQSYDEHGQKSTGRIYKDPKIDSFTATKVYYEYYN